MASEMAHGASKASLSSFISTPFAPTKFQHTCSESFADDHSVFPLRIYQLWYLTAEWFLKYIFQFEPSHYFLLRRCFATMTSPTFQKSCGWTSSRLGVNPSTNRALSGATAMSLTLLFLLLSNPRSLQPSTVCCYSRKVNFLSIPNGWFSPSTCSPIRTRTYDEHWQFQEQIK